MFRSLSLAAFAAALGIHPQASKAEVVPFSTTTGFVYTSDGSAIVSHDAHYEQGSTGLAVDRSQTHTWGSTGFAARSDRTGSLVTLGAKAISSGGPSGGSTYVGGSSSYQAKVNFTPPVGTGIIPAPNQATFQVALEGTLAGGQNAWFSLFNNGSGVYGTGEVGSMWEIGDVFYDLQYVENANGGYDVSGSVDFNVDLAPDGQGGLSALLGLTLDAGASSAEGLAAVADFMDTAKVIGIAFDGRNAEDLGWTIGFTELPQEIVPFDDRGPPGAGGQQTPEPASMMVWGLAVVGLVATRKRQRP
jgi:hypothetical protein